MKRTAICLFVMVLATGCFSDFSSSMSRNDDGTLDAEDIWLAEGTSQYVNAPGNEQFLFAESSDPRVARVVENEGERLIVETTRSGEAVIEFETDASVSLESVTIEVRQPDRLEFHSVPDGEWVATTGEFEVGYDFYADDTELEGAGYKAIERAPGLEIRERPLVLDDVGLLKGTYWRKLRVLAGAPGTFTLETTVGEDVELRRIEDEEVDQIEFEQHAEDVEVGDYDGLSVWGTFDGKKVIGFSNFRARTKTRSVCVVDEQRRDRGYTADIEFKNPGECRIMLKHRKLDWEEIVSYDVR
jgi:hypothetical protein